MRARLKLPPTADGIDERRTEYLYWWLLVAIVFEYVRPGVFVPGIDAAKLNSLIPLSLFVVTLFATGLRPFEKIFADSQARWLTFYLSLIFVSIPFAEVTEYPFKVFKGTFGYFLLFLIIVRVTTSVRRLRGIFGTLILSHLFLIFMNPDIVLNTEVRSYLQGAPFLGDGNDFSLSLCILVPLAIELGRGAKSRIVRLLAWFAVIAMLLAIVGSQSRGATLGIVAVGIFIWILSKRKIASLVGIAVVGAVMMLHASDAYFQRMSTIRNYQGEGSAEGRIIAWKASLRMAMDNPVLGVGAGHFPVAFGTKYMPRDRWPMPWLTAHSTYFLLLGELGLPGLVTILALVIGGVVATMTSRRRVLHSATDPPGASREDMARMLHMLAASVVGFAVPGAFLSAAYYPHIFVLTGILVAAHSIVAASASSERKANAVGRRGRPRSLSR